MKFKFVKRKCAIYLRVSTDIQDYERQKEDLTGFANSNSFSFSENNIYEDKLSGLKGISNRPGLEKLLIDVDDGKIDIVLVWEISRLSRIESELHSIKELFQKKSTNIYFYQQGFWLLDEFTMEITPIAGILIAFYGYNAAYETRLTKERFHSAKKLNVKQGKYNGGYMTFGYTIKKFGKTENDSDKKFILDDKIIDGLNVSEVDIVKEVFDLYESGLTCSKICFFCKSKGYPQIVCSTHTLARLLRNTSYVGYKDVKLGIRPTPPIIEEAQFIRVGNLIDSNKTKADKGKKHVYLLRGMLRCSYCGKFYIGKQTDDSYICSSNSSSNKFNKGTRCDGGNISVSNVDGILWERIKDVWINKKLYGLNDIYETVKKENDEYQNQIKNYKNLITKIEKRRVKSNRIFHNDGYTVEEYDKEISTIINDKKNCEKKITELEVKIRYNEKLNQNANKPLNRKKSIDSITDRTQIKEIIKSLVKDITFSKVNLFKTVINVLYLNGKTETLLYNSVAKKGITFKIFNSKCLRFDRNRKEFYLLQEQFYPLYNTIHSLHEWAKLKLKLNFSETLDNTNCDIYDFDTLMRLSDIPNIITTCDYKKMTYFKELNKKRFSRKKNSKHVVNK